MKKIVYLTLILNLFLFAGDGDELISISGISFNDMSWSDSYGITYEDVLYSKQQISDLIIDKKAVILYFFDLKIC